MEGKAMRNRPITASVCLVIGLALVQASAWAASYGNEDRLVDYRMAPLEQVRKINNQARITGARAEEMVTVMTWDGEGEGEHLILRSENATRETVRGLFKRGRFSSVSWNQLPLSTLGSCDSQAECEKKTKELCKEAGHDGVKKASVTITTHSDGSKTCSADCAANGAVAFVTCNPRR
jgi:hypothetical protein